MPKQHSFAGQTNPPTDEKVGKPPISQPRQASSAQTETLGEGAGWICELLEAVTEFPWLLLVLFPVVIGAALFQKPSGKAPNNSPPSTL